MSLITQDYYTADELAALKDVCLKTVYGWIQKKIAPPAIRDGGRYWFHKKEADAFVKPKRGAKKKK